MHECAGAAALQRPHNCTATHTLQAAAQCCTQSHVHYSSSHCYTYHFHPFSSADHTVQLASAQLAQQLQRTGQQRSTVQCTVQTLALSSPFVHSTHCSLPTIFPSLFQTLFDPHTIQLASCDTLFITHRHIFSWQCCGLLSTYSDVRVSQTAKHTRFVCEKKQAVCAVCNGTPDAHD